MPDETSIVPISRIAELGRLRARIRRLEQGGRGETKTLSLGLPELDAALPENGLPLGAVHELVAADAADGAVYGLAAHWLGLAQRREAGKWVLWCGRTEHLYAPGLRLAGLDPMHLMTVRAVRDEDALWVLEEALRCRDLAGAVAEIESLGLAQSRRLQLAAEAGGIGYLLRAPGAANGEGLGASAAVTRWRIAALPSAAGPASGVLGPPRWRLELMRCRGGRPASWIVEGEDGAPGGFALAAAIRDGSAGPARAQAQG
jgi:protein ImuA